MEPYYNATLNGQGLTGFLSYSNDLVGGLMSVAFLAMVWIVVMVVGMKGEHKASSVLGFASLICFIIGMIMQTFMTVNPIALFVFAILIAISLAWGAVSKQ